MTKCLPLPSLMTYNISKEVVMDNFLSEDKELNDDKSIKICFIGHRDIPSNLIRLKLKDVIENEIKKGCKFFTMGTHGKFDSLALCICKELREKYKDIEIEVVITSLNQIKKSFYILIFLEKFMIPHLAM